MNAWRSIIMNRELSVKTDTLLHFKCKLFAKVFSKSVKAGLDSNKFVNTVMTSDSLTKLFKSDDCFEWCDAEVLFGTLQKYVEFEKGNVLNEDVMWYAGYLYKFWMLTRKMSRKKIYEILPIEALAKRYPFYHTQDWNFVINDAIENFENRKG